MARLCLFWNHFLFIWSGLVINFAELGVDIKLQCLLFRKRLYWLMEHFPLGKVRNCLFLEIIRNTNYLMGKVSDQGYIDPPWLIVSQISLADARKHVHIRSGVRLWTEDLRFFNHLTTSFRYNITRHRLVFHLITDFMFLLMKE